jgi:hypothetical protein
VTFRVCAIISQLFNLFVYVVLLSCGSAVFEIADLSANLSENLGAQTPIHRVNGYRYLCAQRSTINTYLLLGRLNNIIIIISTATTLVSDRLSNDEFIV